MTLLFDSSTHWFEIPDEVHSAAWPGQTAPISDDQLLGDQFLDDQLSGNQLSGDQLSGSQWQAYLNQICLETVLPWLREKFGDEVVRTEPIALPGFWELVNGFALCLGETRLIFVPSEAIARLELRVSQEWVDIPSWVGDYYLAIEVDPDERWLSIWGYTTHQALKAGENYDSDDCAYCLAGSRLITDLNVLWVMHHLATEPTRAPVAMLSQPSRVQAAQWIDRLGTAPRLDLPFGEWGALMEREDWRQQIMDRQRDRQIARQQVIERQQPIASEPIGSPVTTLSLWLQNQFETGWQAIESLISGSPVSGSPVSGSPELAFSLREEAVSGAIVRRIKQVTVQSLSEQTRATTVLLLLILTAEADDRFSVRVRVLPDVGATFLPANLNLSLLSAEGEEVLSSVQARSQDNSIQLRRFRCAMGTQFRVQIALDAAIEVENFIV